MITQEQEELRQSFISLGTNWGTMCGALYKSLCQEGIPEDSALLIVSQMLREYIARLFCPTPPQTTHSRDALIEYFLKTSLKDKPQ